MPGKKRNREDIYWYVWRGERHVVMSGTEMLVKLCDQLRAENPGRFEQLPDQFPAVRKRYFVRSEIAADRGHRFEGTDFWLDTNMSTKQKKEFARKLLRFFGHDEHGIKFETEKSTKR
jgi:hypothetical protein